MNLYIYFTAHRSHIDPLCVSANYTIIVFDILLHDILLTSTEFSSISPQENFPKTKSGIFQAHFELEEFRLLSTTEIAFLIEISPIKRIRSTSNKIHTYPVIK